MRIVAIRFSVVLSILLVFPTLVRAAQEGRQIVATIAPVHSLVQMVLGEFTEAQLLVDNGASVHDFHLKPSQQKLLLEADLVFMIDQYFETFLPRNQNPKIYVPLAESAGITLLEKRRNEHWGEHHHVHDHDDRFAHPVDFHLWLDPENAVQIVESVKRLLIKEYPESGELFKKNADSTIQSLAALDSELQSLLQPIRSQPFIVFHDAYGYFESRYGLNGVGSILLNPDAPPSAKQIRLIRQKIRESKAVCVFSEPQFSDKLVNTVTEGVEINSAMLDPLGAAQRERKTDYIETLRTLASTISDCLSTGTGG